MPRRADVAYNRHVRRLLAFNHAIVVLRGYRAQLETENYCRDDSPRGTEFQERELL
jgi:hypothetical protein